MSKPFNEEACIYFLQKIEEENRNFEELTFAELQLILAQMEIPGEFSLKMRHDENKYFPFTLVFHFQQIIEQENGDVIRGQGGGETIGKGTSEEEAIQEAVAFLKEMELRSMMSY